MYVFYILHGGQRDKQREEMEGGKRDETFFSAFNVHTPSQIVFLNNFAILTL
jgi:hypothetical protein